MIWMALEEVAVMVYGQASVVVTVTGKSTKTAKPGSSGEMVRISSPVDAGTEDHCGKPVWGS